MHLEYLISYCKLLKKIRKNLLFISSIEKDLFIRFKLCKHSCKIFSNVAFSNLKCTVKKESKALKKNYLST